MGLKGALHFFYNASNTVEVHKIVSGGMPYHRELDFERIVGALRGDSSLRAYVSLAPNLEITQQTCDHTICETDSDEFANSQMLQLADLFLGAIRYIITTSRVLASIPKTRAKVASKRAVIAYPVAEMLKEWGRNPHSRRCDYHKSISATTASLENDNWRFVDIKHLAYDSSLLDYSNPII